MTHRSDEASTDRLGNLAKDFYERFLGLDRVRGSYELPPGVKATPGVKFEGKGRTIHKGPSVALWREHLEGKRGLGVVPIRDDSTCVFGVIDVDIYDKSLNEWEAQVRKKGLPLMLIRTKSGGAHFYLFFSEPVPAAECRDKLMDCALAMGFANVEIFPKQSKLAGTDDCGSWLNMPYFGGDSTDRYAIVNGEKLGMEDFLVEAHLRSLSLQDLTGVSTPVDPVMFGAPPCLLHLTQNGFGEGQRNKGLFNLAVFAKKKFSDDWQDRVIDMNRSFLDPPLRNEEVSQIIQSVNRKTYTYSCADSPLYEACSRVLCGRTEHGIRGSSKDPGVDFGSLTKILTDPPTWIVTVNGQRMKLDSSSVLLNQAKFAELCLDVMNVIPNRVTQTAWEGVVRGLLETVEEVEAPDDAGEQGQFIALFEQFCSETAPAKDKEELILGKPWEDDGLVYFRSPDMLRYMKKNGFIITPKQAWNILRMYDAGMERFSVKGKDVRCWSLPIGYEKQTDPFTVPKVDDHEY